MPKDRPAFAVIPSDQGPGWIIEAQWQDGRTEHFIGVYTSPAAAREWLEQGADTWLAQRETSDPT